MELKCSTLLCDTRPGLASLVISQRKLREKSVHLGGVTTKTAILDKINDQRVADAHRYAVFSWNQNRSRCHK